MALFRQLWDDDWYAVPVRSQVTKTEQIFAPKVDVTETKDAYHIVAELPGMSRDDVSIKLEKDFLVLSGEKKQERVESDDEKHFRRIERVYGSFSRQFRLPENVDRNGISAAYENGLLRVALKKKEPEPERSIAIEIHWTFRLHRWEVWSIN